MQLQPWTPMQFLFPQLTHGAIKRRSDNRKNIKVLKLSDAFSGVGWVAASARIKFAIFYKYLLLIAFSHHTKESRVAAKTTWKLISPQCIISFLFVRCRTRFHHDNALWILKQLLCLVVFQTNFFVMCKREKGRKIDGKLTRKPFSAEINKTWTSLLWRVRETLQFFIDQPEEKPDAHCTPKPIAELLRFIITGLGERIPREGGKLLIIMFKIA